MLVAGGDRTINPELERWYAARAGSHRIEVGASHSVYISRPKEVATLIEEAAREVRQCSGSEVMTDIDRAVKHLEEAD